MISASNLAMSYGDRTLFRNASFQLNPGERYGLVGANGCGKTTLLSILAGDLQPSDGAVSRPKHLRLGVLRQDQFLYESERVIDVAQMGNAELWQANVDMQEVLANADEHFDAERFSELEEVIQRFDGYSAESRAATILEGLGLPQPVHEGPLSRLSGGFKLRVLLAQVLAGNPDVLLLDEPTNHLDILSIRWLETFLQEFAGPVVVISHDHRFLDNVSSHILDVDYETVTLYTGNYSAFLPAKSAERERREKDIENREREIAHHQKFVDRFRAKASKARQAQSKMRMIEKEASQIQSLPPSSRRYPSFRFAQKRDSGKEVLKVKGIEKAFGENRVLHGVDLTVNRGDRLAIMGPNGIGKSTLLKIVMGRLEADQGEVEWGYETHPGYFAQEYKEELSPPSRTAEQYLWDSCPEKDIGFVRGHLALMLFTGDDSHKKLGSLSGGEAARLVFSRLALERPNVLVLDEPTNHLDLESIEALVDGLRAFEGTFILVSHDRWFVSQLASRIVEITADGIRDYQGTYEEYVQFCGDDHLDADQVVLKAKKEQKQKTRSKKEPKKRAGTPKRKSNIDRQALEQEQDALLAEVAEAESRGAELDSLFCQPDFFSKTPSDEVRALERERADITGQVSRLTQRWEEIVEALAESAEP